MPPTVPIEPPGVFIDSAGFIALYVSSDQHHQAAVACRDKTLKFSRRYTSSLVISETVAHIQRDNLLDQQDLADLINDFLKAEIWVAILPADDELLKKRLRLVKERSDPRFSLVDATNILLMEKHRIDTIFSFDSLYDGETVMRGFNARFIQRIGP